MGKERFKATGDSQECQQDDSSSANEVIAGQKSDKVSKEERKRSNKEQCKMDRSRDCAGKRTEKSGNEYFSHSQNIRERLFFGLYQNNIEVIKWKK